jgi:hypothetical protein
MIKKIEIPIYKGNVVVIQKKNLNDVPEKYFPSSGVFGYEAITDVYEHESGFKEYVMIFEKPTNSRIIAHESLHFMSMLFRDRDINMSYDNDEMGAYLIGWIVGELHKCLKINDKTL